MWPCRLRSTLPHRPTLVRPPPSGGQQRASSDRKTESVKVHTRSNGSVTLDIHYPSTAPSANAGSPKVLLYLPRGPLHAKPAVDAACVSTLRKVWPHYIVQLNYRATRAAQYPTPIHDVLAGYDWVLEHLLAKSSIARAGRADRVGQVAVCGELVGGALATMLALTECHAGQPGVAAAAVNCPILDWTALPDAARLPYSKADTPLSSNGLPSQLLSLRDALFRKPEHYFDPFASPYLFFRAPATEVPPMPRSVPLDDLEHLALLEREEYFQQQQALSTGNLDVSDESLEDPVVQRRARRVFPPMGSRLTLPPFSISAGSTGPLVDQATAMSKVLRQSFVRQANKLEFGRKVLTEEELDEDERAGKQAKEAEAKQKVQLKLHDSSGLWDDSHAGQSRVMEVGRWLLAKVT